MMVRLVFAVFIGFVMLNVCESERELMNLSDLYVTGVKLAEQQINTHTGIQHHFRFYKSIKRSDIEAGFNVNYIYHHFYLKATKCSRGTENTDMNKCSFRNDRPVIDCVLCYKMFNDEMESEPKPYVHCIHKPAVTQEMEESRISHCNKMSYSSGVSTLLASIGSK